MAKDFDKDAPLRIERPAGGATIIAVGGGKGGIGKSMLSANLGVALAQIGKRVLLVDADLGGANLHSCLGIAPPPRTLGDFLEKKVESFKEVIAPTPVAGLGLVSGALDEVGAANPKYSQKHRLLRQIAHQDADYVVIDLGAGTSYNTLDFFLLADRGIVSMLPEPTSIENAYRFVKATFFRKLKSLEQHYGLGKTIGGLMRDRDALKIRTPIDLMKALVHREPARGEKLVRELAQLPLSLVVNQVRGHDDVAMAMNVRTACSKYFGIAIELLGTIPYDNAVWQAVKQRQSVLLHAKDSEAARAIVAMARKLDGTRAPAPAPAPPRTGGANGGPAGGPPREMAPPVAEALHT